MGPPTEAASYLHKQSICPHPSRSENWELRGPFKMMGCTPVTRHEPTTHEACKVRQSLPAGRDITKGTGLMAQGLSQPPSIQHPAKVPGRWQWRARGLVLWHAWQTQRRFLALGLAWTGPGCGRHLQSGPAGRACLSLSLAPSLAFSLSNKFLNVLKTPLLLMSHTRMLAEECDSFSLIQNT